jgi:hypothetical protein
MRTGISITSAALVLVPFALVGALALGTKAQSQQPARNVEPVRKVDMGDYEPVVPWPQPLARHRSSHAAGHGDRARVVWAESPDKVWVQQRGEIELPPGAEPWTCACLLNPRRTNTGRRDYSGKPYPYKMRRHHILFAVDRNGKTIEEWLQHDNYLAPPRGTGLGEMGRGPHKILMNPYDREKRIWIIDDDMHEINIFSNDGKLLKTMGVRGVPGRGPNNFNRPTDIAWLPDGTFFVADGYAGVRVAKFDPNGKFIKDWGRTPVDPANPKAYEFWSVHSIGISRDRRLFVADREHHRMQVFDEDGNFLTMWPTGYNSSVPRPYRDAGRSRLGGGLDHQPSREVRPRRALHTRHRRARRAARPVRRGPPDSRRFGAEPVRDRGGEQPFADVPAEAQRRSEPARRSDGHRESRAHAQVGPAQDAATWLLA